MAFVSCSCKCDLLLAIRKTLFLIFAQAVVTTGTGNTFKVERGFFVFPSDRIAASITLIVGSFFKIVINGYPLIKNETFSLPGTFRFRNIFQILKDAALKMKHILKPF